MQMTTGRQTNRQTVFFISGTSITVSLLLNIAKVSNNNNNNKTLALSFKFGHVTCLCYESE